jgi:alkaline phosphatase
MPYAYDGLGTLPDLKTMTMKALELLSKDEDGFFLMVESGRIDHASHGNDLRRAVEEVLELDAAVQAALEWAAGRGDTTILVTADHETGGLGLDLAVTPGVLPADDSGIWSTGGHTGVPVPLFVWGVGASRFAALQLDNTEIPNILLRL